MKTQRRHELQTNELADHIGNYMQAIRPYQNIILFGTVAVVAVVVAALWLNRQNQAKASLSWGDYFSALDAQRPEALEDVAKFHNGSTAAFWAQQSAGDMQLAAGSRQIYQDRKESEKSLKDAEKSLKAVESGAGNQPELVRRARFGLGRVYEAMCDVENAKDYYKKVAEDAPESVLGKLAEQRFKRLSEESVERWYAWFERQEPVLPGGMDAASGPGMDPLGDLGDLPDRPDLSFPADSLLNEPLSTDEPGDASSEEAGDVSVPTDDAVAPESADQPDEAMDDDATGEATEPETTEPETPEAEMTEPDPTEPETPVADESDSPAESPASDDSEPGEENEKAPAVPAEEPPVAEADEDASDSSPGSPDESAADESEPSDPASSDESFS